jgi:hypothetical protein
METIRYEFILEAIEPIAHHSETIGNEAIVMRESVRQSDGTFAEVPIITGDTMRHGLREVGAYAYLDAAGKLDDPQLTEGALRLLFNGGMMTGKGSARAIDLDAYRRMSKLLPLLPLLGGCTDNRIVPGNVEVSRAIAICDETLSKLSLQSPWLADAMKQLGEVVGPAATHIDEEQRVRMDPTLVPAKRQLMTSDAQVHTNKRLASSEKAHVEDDAIDARDSKSSMMPRRFEVVKTGTLFHWATTTRVYSPLERDTWNLMVGLFLANCRVGGKRGSGHGSLRVRHAVNVNLRPFAPETSALVPLGDVSIGKMFREHVKANAAEISELLKTVVA